MIYHLVYSLSPSSSEKGGNANTVPERMAHETESNTKNPENQTIESLSVDQFTSRKKVKTERSLAL